MLRTSTILSLSTSLLLLSACNPTKDVVITVDANGFNADDITALRLVLFEGDLSGEEEEPVFDSGEAIFDNGDPIEFPVTLSTRVNVDRNEDLHIGVVALDENGRALGSGSDEISLNQDAKKFNAEVIIDSDETCLAGDGADEGCCQNLVDDDGFGFIDCFDEACQFASVCQGACGDGVLDFFRGEFCDDGNNEDGDGCDFQCVSEDEKLIGFLRYFQIDNFVNNVVAIGLLPVLDLDGTFGVANEVGDCQMVGFSPNVVEFLIGDIGILDVFDGNNVDPVRSSNVLFFEFINDVVDFQPGDTATIQNSGGLALDPQSLSFAFPSKLQIDDPEPIIRGEDYRITWTDQGSGEDVFLNLFDLKGRFMAIFCQVPEENEEMIVPGELTQLLPQGDFDFIELTGAGLQIGNGFRADLPDENGEPTNITVDVLNGFEFLVDVK